MHRFDYINFPEITSTRMSSPTCEDLGIPRNSTEMSLSLISAHPDHLSAMSESHHYFDPFQRSDPFSPSCLIPLPNSFGLENSFEPAFIRKRNERERERVRCVNEGYVRLKRHLPIQNKEKRISKVETLRAAIQYIKYLQDLLKNSEEEEDSAGKVCPQGCTVSKRPT